MGINQDGKQVRRDQITTGNPKLDENPNFGIMKSFEEAGGSENIFKGYQNSSGVY